MKKFITKTLLITILGISLASVSSAQTYNIQRQNVSNWVGHTIKEYTDTVTLLKDNRLVKPVQIFNITPDIFARVYTITYKEEKTTDLPFKITYTFNHSCNIKFLLDKTETITKGELSGSDLACEQVSKRLGLTPAPGKK